MVATSSAPGAPSGPWNVTDAVTVPSDTTFLQWTSLVVPAHTILIATAAPVTISGVVAQPLTSPAVLVEAKPSLPTRLPRFTSVVAATPLVVPCADAAHVFGADDVVGMVLRASGTGDDLAPLAACGGANYTASTTALGRLAATVGSVAMVALLDTSPSCGLVQTADVDVLVAEAAVACPHLAAAFDEQYVAGGGGVDVVFQLPSPLFDELLPTAMLALGTAPGLSNVVPATTVDVGSGNATFTLRSRDVVLSPSACFPVYACLFTGTQAGSTCAVCTASPAWIDTAAPVANHSTVTLYHGDDVLQIVSSLTASASLPVRLRSGNQSQPTPLLTPNYLTVVWGEFIDACPPQSPSPLTYTLSVHTPGVGGDVPVPDAQVVQLGRYFVGSLPSRVAVVNLTGFGHAVYCSPFQVVVWAHDGAGNAGSAASLAVNPVCVAQPGSTLVPLEHSCAAFVQGFALAASPAVVPRSSPGDAIIVSLGRPSATADVVTVVWSRTSDCAASPALSVVITDVAGNVVAGPQAAVPTPLSSTVNYSTPVPVAGLLSGQLLLVGLVGVLPDGSTVPAAGLPTPLSVVIDRSPPYVTAVVLREIGTNGTDFVAVDVVMSTSLEVCVTGLGDDDTSARTVGLCVTSSGGTCVDVPVPASAWPQHVFCVSVPPASLPWSEIGHNVDNCFPLWVSLTLTDAAGHSSRARSNTVIVQDDPRMGGGAIRVSVCGSPVNGDGFIQQGCDVTVLWGQQSNCATPPLFEYEVLLAPPTGAVRVAQAGTTGNGGWNTLTVLYDAFLHPAHLSRLIARVRGKMPLGSVFPWLSSTLTICTLPPIVHNVTIDALSPTGALNSTTIVVRWLVDDLGCPLDTVYIVSADACVTVASLGVLKHPHGVWLARETRAARSIAPARIHTHLLLCWF